MAEHTKIFRQLRSAAMEVGWLLRHDPIGLAKLLLPPLRSDLRKRDLEQALLVGRALGLTEEQARECIDDAAVYYAPGDALEQARQAMTRLAIPDGTPPRVTVTLPDGTVVTPSPTRVGTGVYHYDYTATQVGQHRLGG